MSKSNTLSRENTCKNRQVDYMKLYQKHLKSNQIMCSINVQPMSLQNHMKDRVVTKNMYSRTFFMFRHSQTYLNFKMVKAEDKYQEFALLIFIDSCWTCVLGMF